MLKWEFTAPLRPDDCELITALFHLERLMTGNNECSTKEKEESHCHTLPPLLSLHDTHNLPRGDMQGVQAASAAENNLDVCTLFQMTHNEMVKHFLMADIWLKYFSVVLPQFCSLFFGSVLPPSSQMSTQPVTSQEVLASDSEDDT